MDYSKYGTPSKQWLAFEAANPIDARDGFSDNDLSIAEELRNKTNASRDTLLAEHYARTSVNEKVDISTIQVPTRDGETIPLRRAVPRGHRGRPLRAMIFFHGGGMLFGSETSDDHTCAEFASTLNIAVLSVVYRHTPKCKFPTQINDGLDAFDYILQHAEELHIDLDQGIAMVGNSSGALAATAVVLHDLAQAKKEGRKTVFSGVVLTTPWLIHIENYPFHVFASPEKSSRVQCRDGAVLPWDRLKLFSDLMASPSADEPLLNPALVPDEALQGWPKTGFVVAGMDTLRDDALYFAKRLESLNVRTSVHVFPGQPHGFRNWMAIPAAMTFDDRTIDCIGWALNMCGPKMVGWHEYQEQ
ncbi:Fc.00g024270.m01.CDS01 [Cosmosporella sp. VM-42]